MKITPGVYRHYKGPMYIVLGVARHSETEERGVVYFGVEPHGDEAPMWSWRPLLGPGGFLTPVPDVSHPAVPDHERFKFLYPVNSMHVERIQVSFPKEDA